MEWISLFLLAFIIAYANNSIGFLAIFYLVVIACNIGMYVYAQNSKKELKKASDKVRENEIKSQKRFIKLWENINLIFFLLTSVIISGGLFYSTGVITGYSNNLSPFAVMKGSDKYGISFISILLILAITFAAQMFLTRAIRNFDKTEYRNDVAVEYKTDKLSIMCLAVATVVGCISATTGVFSIITHMVFALTLMFVSTIVKEANSIKKKDKRDNLISKLVNGGSYNKVIIMYFWVNVIASVSIAISSYKVGFTGYGLFDVSSLAATAGSICMDVILVLMLSFMIAGIKKSEA